MQIVQTLQQQMGCAVCISGSEALIPQVTISESYLHRFSKELQKLKPCSLINQQEFDILKTSCRNPQFFSKKIIQPKQSNSNSQTRPFSQDINLVNRWKLLVLCSGTDFFEEQWENLDKQKNHRSFVTVQKDFKRTFSDCASMQEKTNSEVLENVLKMLAIYFPKIGYTQGLNYLAGYLIMLGFTEKQCFWFIVHLALNEKYMILGLFEDYFPTVKLHCKLFKLIFSSKLPDLYAKFSILEITDDVWIFKWFLTLYIYSIPISAIKMILDFIFVVGTKAEVYLAVALLMHLQNKMPHFDDSIDIVQFFDSLKEESSFHKLINTNEWLSIAIQISQGAEKSMVYLEQSDVQGQIEIKNTFYAQYFCSKSDEKKKELYMSWLQSVQKQRSDYWSIAPQSSEENTIKKLRKKLKKARINNIGERINRVRVNSSSHIHTYFDKPINSDESQLVQLKQAKLQPKSESKIPRTIDHHSTELIAPRKSQCSSEKQDYFKQKYYEKDFIAEFQSAESIHQDEVEVGKKEKSSTTQDAHTKKSDLDLLSME